MQKQNKVLKTIVSLMKVTSIAECSLGAFCNTIGTTVKPVLSGHSKIDKTKVLKTIVSLMKVISIAGCSLGAFCNTIGTMVKPVLRATQKKTKQRS